MKICCSHHGGYNPFLCFSTWIDSHRWAVECESARFKEVLYRNRILG